MKEPELEENDLRATVRGDRIDIVRRTLEPDGRGVEVTFPNGNRETVALTEGADGRATGSLRVSDPGIYHLTDGERVAIAAVGALNPVEMADVRTSEEPLRIASATTGGQILWLADGAPDIRRVRPNRDTGGKEPGGRGWIGLRANGDYVVAGILQLPLLPGLALFLLALATLVLAWRREGR